MQLFYTNNVSEGTAAFSREESGHCIRVLRMHRGDVVHFTDGAGNMYVGIIIDDDPLNKRRRKEILQAACGNITAKERGQA
jgi:16S rRNA U1498 N3-methylase RsmE